MKDKKVGIIVFILLLLVVMGLGVVWFLNDDKEENKVNEVKGTSANKVEEVPEVSSEEKQEDDANVDVQAFVNDVVGPLGWLVVIDTFVDGRVKYDVDYLGSMNNRQLFVMEYILRDENSHGDFVVLSSDGKSILEDGSPVSQATYAYYPYDKFNVMYKKFFDRDFSKADKAISYGGYTEYDSNDDYIYYVNRRSGANGLGVTEMKILEKVPNDDGGNYTAKVEITYSERLASNLKMNSSKGEIIYHISDGRVIMDSFMLKEE